MNIDQIATGRDYGLFDEDVRTMQPKLEKLLNGRRILVIGGAGSIGSATVKALLPYEPLTIHVIDQNENQLAELIRDLRSSSLAIKDFQTLPIDFGSNIMKRYLADNKPFDYVLNFAAIKHVRSEKDPYSLLQMLDTNLIKPMRLISWLDKATSRYFSVSTDKAANPVNLMGASKSLMERLIFSSDSIPVCTSARFANVAFSNGSLLESFKRRLEKRQPLAVPKSTTRFFVSQAESGAICLLAAFAIADKQILIPKVSEKMKLTNLEDIAVSFLKHHGYDAIKCNSEKQALEAMSDSKTQYPLLVTDLNTAGEKPYEEFIAEGENTIDVGMDKLVGIKYSPEPSAAFFTAMKEIETLISTDKDIDNLHQIIESIVPQLEHIKSNHQLDQRM